jgi:hypothetical protein
MKRSDRGEPIWFVIHMCIEAILGISLYGYLYLEISLSQASKNAVFLIISYVFSSTKFEKSAEHILPRSQEVGEKREGVGDMEGEMAQTIYIHMHK